jgi:hypothetical protein
MISLALELISRHLRRVPSNSSALERAEYAARDRDLLWYFLRGSIWKTWTRCVTFLWWMLFARSRALQAEAGVDGHDSGEHPARQSRQRVPARLDPAHRRILLLCAVSAVNLFHSAHRVCASDTAS